jgi:hypothetical protein
MSTVIDFFTVMCHVLPKIVSVWNDSLCILFQIGGAARELFFTPCIPVIPLPCSRWILSSREYGPDRDSFQNLEMPRFQSPKKFRRDGRNFECYGLLRRRICYGTENSTDRKTENDTRRPLDSRAWIDAVKIFEQFRARVSFQKWIPANWSVGHNQVDRWIISEKCSGSDRSYWVVRRNPPMKEAPGLARISLELRIVLEICRYTLDNNS